MTDLEVAPGLQTSPPILAALLWPRIGTQVNQHLELDGYAPVAELDPHVGLQHRRNGAPPGCRNVAGSGIRPEDVSVVVRVPDAHPALERLLVSLFTGVSKPREVLLSLQGRAQGDVIRMVKTRFPKEPVRVVQYDRSGSAGSRNTAAARSDGTVLAFLDGDAEPDACWLEGILRGFARHPRVGAVTGLVTPGSLERSSQVRLWTYLGLPPDAMARLYDSDVLGAPHRWHRHLRSLYRPGGNFAIRRDVFEQLGGFDEYLGSSTGVPSAEDFDLLTRLVLEGHLLAFEPQAWVRHTYQVGVDDVRSLVFDYGRGAGAVLLKQALGSEAGGAPMHTVRRGVRYVQGFRGARPSGARPGGVPWSLDIARLAGVASAALDLRHPRSWHLRTQVP